MPYIKGQPNTIHSVIDYLFGHEPETVERKPGSVEPGIYQAPSKSIPRKIGEYVLGEELLNPEQTLAMLRAEQTTGEPLETSVMGRLLSQAPGWISPSAKATIPMFIVNPRSKVYRGIKTALGKKAFEGDEQFLQAIKDYIAVKPMEFLEKIKSIKPDESFVHSGTAGQARLFKKHTPAGVALERAEITLAPHTKETLSSLASPMIKAKTPALHELGHVQHHDKPINKLERFKDAFRRDIAISSIGKAKKFHNIGQHTPSHTTTLGETIAETWSHLYTHGETPFTKAVKREFPNLYEQLYFEYLTDKRLAEKVWKERAASKEAALQYFRSSYLKGLPSPAGKTKAKSVADKVLGAMGLGMGE